MRTKNIQIGEHYAVGSPQDDRKLRARRAEVLEKGLHRQVFSRFGYRRSRHADGVKVRYLNDDGTRGRAPYREEVVPAQQILSVWEEELERRERIDQRRAERAARWEEKEARMEELRQRVVEHVCHEEPTDTHKIHARSNSIEIEADLLERLLELADEGAEALDEQARIQNQYPGSL